MPDLAAVENLLARWWFEYDQGNFTEWPAFFTAKARFTCRSDSGATAFEEFVTADVTGRDALIAWQIDHRRSSPFPLRHNATNTHLTTRADTTAQFRSYLFVTHIVGGGVANLSTGICHGVVAEDDETLKIAELHVILDFTDSVPFTEAATG